VMLAMTALLPSDSHRLRRRVATVAERGARGSAGLAMPDAAGILLPGAERGDGAVDQLLLKLLPRPEQLRLRLQRAGLSTDLRRYLAAILIAGAATSATLWLVLGLAPLAALLFGLTGGIAMPQLVLGFLIRRRKMRFLQQFPEALDLVVRGLRSGLPVTESMKTVSTEVPDPVGGEFRRIVESLAIGNSLEQAMWAAATRIDITDFNFFVVSLQLQRDTGGNLAETLENLADVVRRRRQLKLKIKAISAEGRASAYIIGLLPFAMFGVIWMTSPSYLGPLLSDVRGHIMLGVAVVWLLIGVAVMARMVRFEI
jgi:tight adherence protein B